RSFNASCSSSSIRLSSRPVMDPYQVPFLKLYSEAPGEPPDSEPSSLELPLSEPPSPYLIYPSIPHLGFLYLLALLITTPSTPLASTCLPPPMYIVTCSILSHKIMSPGLRSL